MPRHELPVPEAAETDANARELVRVWAAHGAQHVTLATGLWRDPAAWGIMLVDLARHVAAAYRENSGLNPAETLERIRQGFAAEWDHPTDTVP